MKTMRELFEQMETMAEAKDYGYRIAVVKQGQIIRWFKSLKVAQRHGKEVYNVSLESLIPGEDPDKISSYKLAIDYSFLNKD
jgi:hypothetical protein